MNLRHDAYYMNSEFSLICAENTKNKYATPDLTCFKCGEQTKYMLKCWGNFDEGRYRAHCTNCVSVESLKSRSYRV